MAGQVRSRRRGLVALSALAAVLAVAWLGTWPRLDADRRQRAAGVRLGGIYGLGRVAALAATQMTEDRSAAFEYGLAAGGGAPRILGPGPGADVRDAVGLVRTNSHRPPASWPPGFDWRAAGARLVRAC
jgi:hypothetical protein